MMSDECPTTASHVHQIHTSHLGSAALAAAANREPAASVAGAGASNSSMHNISFGEQHVVTTRTSMPSLRAVDVARIENHWRQVYAEKLRGATQGITTALSAELPRDHIFVQLMSDPLTHQFCKIRLGEVVETYLYSVQAHQYHNLAAEVSRLDMELCRLSAENEELHQHVEWLTVERDDAHRNNTTTSHCMLRLADCSDRTHVQCLEIRKKRGGREMSFETYALEVVAVSPSRTDWSYTEIVISACGHCFCMHVETRPQYAKSF